MIVRVALVAALVLVAGCLFVNPGFDEPEPGATTSIDPTTGGLATTTTSASTTSGPATDSLGGTTGTTGNSTGTTGPAHDPVTLDATVGTCVLLPITDQPYVGPDDCEGIAFVFNATQQTGLTVVDTDLNGAGGNGRTALTFLRFDLPPDIAGLPIQSLKLELQVADGVEAAGDGGHLHSTAPFDLDSLKLAAPDKVAELAPPKGNVGAGTIVTWAVDPAARTGDALYLGLWPSSSTTVVYHGHRSSITKPRLHVTF